MLKGISTGTVAFAFSQVLPVFSDASNPTSPDPLGGWASIMLQGGAFGLLTYMVAYLVPRELKSAREERNARDKHFQEIVDNLNSKFDDRNGHIVHAVEKQTETLQTSFEKSSDKIHIAVAAACRARNDTSR